MTAAIAPSPQFAISDEFYYDRRTNRYRYRDSNRFAPREALINLTQRNIERQQEELTRLADRYAQGNISIRELQREAAERLKTIHVQSAWIGANGVERLSLETQQRIWLDVANELRRQYHTGIDPLTGDRYGLKVLGERLLNGELTEAQLRESLRKFSESGRKSYWAAAKRAEADDRPYATRKLDRAAEHCKECVDLAKLPPRPVGDVPVPGEACRCIVNCRCSLLFWTLEQAIARGMTA